MKLTRENFIPFLGLKGWLTFCVIWTHYLMFFMRLDQSPSFRFLMCDYQVTMLFFLLSGFSLALSGPGSHGDRHGQDNNSQSKRSKRSEEPKDPVPSTSSWTDIKRTWIKRILRFWPMYLVAVVLRLPLFVAYLKAQGESDKLWSIILSVVTMTQTVGPQPLILHFYNASLWQISVIFWCSMMAPLLLPRIRRLSVRGLIGGFLVCYLTPLVLHGLVIAHFDAPESLFFAYIFIAIRAPHFFAGVFAAFLLEKALATTYLTGGWWWDWLADGGVAAMVLGRHEMHFHLDYVLMPLHVLWLVALLCSSNRCWTKRALTLKPLCYLGIVSYSANCLHLVIFYWVTWLLYGLVPISPSEYVLTPCLVIFDWYHFAWLFPLALAISHLAHIHIEEPMAKLALSSHQRR